MEKGLAVVVLVLVLVLPLGPCECALQVGYYNGKCNSTDVEAIIRDVVHNRIAKDRSVVAALLRMQFHDCFVMGCDASILLDGSSSEKTAIPNLSVRGYNIIDQAKAALEKACPGMVSCADIIVAATRDAVSLSGGMRYEVQMGRRDGLVSNSSNVNLPSPTISVSDSIAAFAKKGLTATEMVLLLGGHTVGVAHCSLFKDRLYNFQGTGKRDPSMDLFLAITLSLRCPRNATADNTVNLDQNFLSALVVDNDYYKQLLLGRGVLQIDQALAMDSRTKTTVKSLASSFDDFASQFAKAMINLGTVEVLTDGKGEIRRSCRSIN